MLSSSINAKRHLEIPREACAAVSQKGSEEKDERMHCPPIGENQSGPTSKI